MAEALTIERREGVGIAHVMARQGVDRATIAAAIGLALPDRPQATMQGAMTAVGTGPGAWLILCDGACENFAESLTDRLTGLASVSDQTSGYVLHRMSGPDARTALQRGAALDFDPSIFGPGSAATTVIAHIGVILWQVDDRPSYDLAIFRSFADSFGHWLSQTAASL